MRKNAENLSRGFSLLEALVVMGIVSVVLTMAILSFTSVLPNARANSAMDQVLSQMRSAREQAISHRREVQIQFVGTNQLIISELWLKGAPLRLSPIPSKVEPSTSFSPEFLILRWRLETVPQFILQICRGGRQS